MHGISKDFIEFNRSINDISRRILTRVRPELLPQVEQLTFLFLHFDFHSSYKLPENESHNLIIDTLYKSWQLYNNKKYEKLFSFIDLIFRLKCNNSIRYSCSWIQYRWSNADRRRSSLSRRIFSSNQTCSHHRYLSFLFSKFRQYSLLVSSSRWWSAELN